MLIRGLWGMQVSFDKPKRFKVASSFKMTMASIYEFNGPQRTSVYITFQGSTYLLLSLTPEKIEQQVIDVTFLQGESIELSVEGPNVIHLIGNYISQDGIDEEDDEDSEDSLGEEDQDLDEALEDMSDMIGKEPTPDPLDTFDANYEMQLLQEIEEEGRQTEDTFTEKLDDSATYTTLALNHLSRYEKEDHSATATSDHDTDVLVMDEEPIQQVSMPLLEVKQTSQPAIPASADNISMMSTDQSDKKQEQAPKSKNTKNEKKSGGQDEDTKKDKANKSVESNQNAEKAKPIQNTKKAKPKQNAEKSKPKQIIEKAKPKQIIEKAKPKQIIEKAKPKQTIEKAKLKQNVEKAKPKQNADKAKPQQNPKKGGSNQKAEKVKTKVEKEDTDKSKAKKKKKKKQKEESGENKKALENIVVEPVKRKVEDGYDLIPEVVTASISRTSSTTTEAPAPKEKPAHEEKPAYKSQEQALQQLAFDADKAKDSEASKTKSQLASNTKGDDLANAQRNEKEAIQVKSQSHPESTNPAKDLSQTTKETSQQSEDTPQSEASSLNGSRRPKREAAVKSMGQLSMMAQEDDKEKRRRSVKRKAKPTTLQGNQVKRKKLASPIN